MNTVEEIKEFFRNEIIRNKELLQKANDNYLSELEIHFGKSKEDLKEDELAVLEHFRDTYYSALKENEFLNYLTYELFIKNKNEGENNGE